MIYVDPLLEWNAYGYKMWCHLGIDDHQNLEPLHVLALAIGLQRRWFQNKPGHPHYDIAGKRLRDAAIRRGAVDVDHQVYVEKCSKNFRDCVLTDDEKRSITSFRRQNVITVLHLQASLVKLRQAGYRLDALAEAWEKDVKNLQYILELPTSTTHALLIQSPIDSTE